MNSIIVTKLTSEYAKNPIGLAFNKPRLSWIVDGTTSAIIQDAYWIQGARTEKELLHGMNLLFDTDWVVSPKNSLVAYPGEKVPSASRVYWKVKVRTDNGEESDFSEIAFFETSIETLSAEWISSPLIPLDTPLRSVPLLRKEYHTDKNIVQARLYATARGLYIPHVNGTRLDRTLFNPGCTNYHKRILFQTYDITPLMVSGNNCFGAEISTGWYAGHYGYEGNINNYGDTLAYCAEVHLQFDDGSTDIVLTDGSWKTATGPIIYSDIYYGEQYDAQKELPGWDKTGFDDNDWIGVQVQDFSHAVLYPHEGVPVVKAGYVQAKSFSTTPKGDLVIDMGQNLVGWLRVRLQGEKGSRFSCDFAEVLDSGGEFYTENLRIEGIQDTYILKGSDEEYFEPSFTFHGFRYVRILEQPTSLSLEDIVGVVIHSDMPPVGEFSCDNEDLNQLQRNIIWGQKGNFLDIPTDCPQRDERLGWTGDAQVFISTAAFNFEVAPFFRKWLRDLASEQLCDGNVPVVVPNVLGGMNHPPFGGAGWGDAAIICPWNLYHAYGDLDQLREFYPMMQAWNAYVSSRSPNYLWENDFQFGDWLALDQPADSNSTFGGTDKDQIATSFYAFTTGLMAKAANVLGKDLDAKKYQIQHENILKAFNAEYVTPGGRVGSNTQTSYILALMFDLLPGGYRKLALDRLVKDIEARDYHLSSGFLGISYLLFVLSRFGRYDVAYKLLLQDTFPSWLYPIRMGSTTIWERWDGIRPDGSFQTPGMNSFNHYAYGSVGLWMYEHILGFTGDEGYTHLSFTFPEACPLGSAKGSFNSVQGLITSSWVKEENCATWEVSIPGNTVATLKKKTQDYEVISISTKETQESEYIQLGSGSYTIELHRLKS